jgi:hypothetical protein
MQKAVKIIPKREVTQADVDRHNRIEYDKDRANLNNFSYWFPKIKDCGMLVPESHFFIMPFNVYEKSIEGICDGHASNELQEWITQNALPKMPKHKPVFIKNGVFSNKFNFDNCLATKDTLTDNYLSIQNGAMCLEAGGYTELVLRRQINNNKWQTATIYNGMPLRIEIRTFYDFDKRDTLYSVNYWDYEYIAPHLGARTDKIIFDHVRHEIEEGFRKHRMRVEAKVFEHMANVQGLEGIWSIDALIDENGEYWLIDMALGATSVYNEGLYDKAALEIYRSGKTPTEKPYISDEIFHATEMAVHNTDGTATHYRRQGNTIVKYIYQEDDTSDEAGVDADARFPLTKIKLDKYGDPS